MHEMVIETDSDEDSDDTYSHEFTATQMGTVNPGLTQIC